MERSPRDFDYWVHQLRARQGQGEYSKAMGLEYWLEMVDRKHRYGSNLLKYHKVWQDSSSQENFFYWLDEGEGKDEDLEGCSREKLEEQQLHYLSREQRGKYLIDVGQDGLLRWHTNGEKVTTHVPDEEHESKNDGTVGKSETRNHMTDDLHNARGILQGAGHAVPAPLAKLIEKNQDKASWIFVSFTSKAKLRQLSLVPANTNTHTGNRHSLPHLRRHQEIRRLPAQLFPPRLPRPLRRPHKYRRRDALEFVAAQRPLPPHGREFLDYGEVP